MGIQGLLPLLKSIMNPIHIKELEGCFVAVDTYSWLHKGAFSCSTEICKGQPTTKHIDYCMHRVNMLRHYGVKPILVFDGGPLPMKTEQEIKRARSRRENLSRAMEHESNGNLSAAYECYQKAVDISPSVAYDLIQVLKHENVSYIVAPYEADAQMTFLAVSKHVEAVITEDSDLIAFGCPRIIYKMDKFGQGVEFKNAMLQHNKELNLAGFTQMMLLEMCILSGCDYLQSLPGMGLKKAHALMKKFKNHKNVIKHLKYNNVDITPFYEESFKKAILTFMHQRVYDPISEDIVYLSEPVDVNDEDLDFLGPLLAQPVAKGIAEGDIDPVTREPIQRESGASEKTLNGTYQLKLFNPDGERKKIDWPVQKNLLTNYFCFASLEAKRKFRAPRSVPNENSETPSPHVASHEEKNCSEAGDLKFLGVHDHGGRGSSCNREVLGDRETQPFTILQNSVCKPCISLHKDLDSVRENGREASGNKNVIRSSYFLNKPIKEYEKENKSPVYRNGDNILDNVVSDHSYEPLSALTEKTCKRGDKRVSVRSSYFRPSVEQNANGQIDNIIEKYSFKKHESSVDDGVESETVKHTKHRVTSTYFGETSANENYQSKNTAVRGFTNEAQSMSTDDSVEYRLKRRKIAQSEIAIDANINWRSEQTCKREDKRISVRSSYFQPSMEQNANDQIDNVFEKYSFKNHDSCVDDDVESETAAKFTKHGVSTYFRETFANKSYKSKDTAIKDITSESHSSSLGSLSSDNSLDCRVEKRKIAQRESPSDANDNNQTSGYTSDLVEEEKTREERFGCNISHLGRYSDIAEQSMEKFVSVISSFRFNPSGSRASGLRAPLKDIKNNCMRRRRSIVVRDI